MVGDLYEATRDLHHSAEQHPFGARMAVGEIEMQEWADWLQAMVRLHLALDPYLPPCLQRGGALMLDVACLLPVEGRPSPVADAFAATLPGNPMRTAGAAYILCGAHLRGGAVIRRRLQPQGLPCTHLRYEHAREANNWLSALRGADATAPGARSAFQAIIGIMDEIQGRAT